MINFIVVDDIKYFLDEVCNVINRIMMKNNCEYKIHAFDDYNTKFIDVVRSDMPNKVYILDIEAKTASGLDMARLIRKNDLNSVIMFLTVHEELSSVVSKDQLMILTFICKFDDFKKNLKNALDKALLFLDKGLIIKFNDRGTIYTIDIGDILYVTRDTVERKSIIKTSYAAYKVNKSLIEIKELCLNRLKQTHRCCLVNEDKISKICTKKNEIIFDNGERIDMVSSTYKKEIKKCSELVG